MNLVASAELELHYHRENYDKHGAAIYVDPNGMPWKAHYVGKVLPASRGTQHKATGCHAKV